MRTPRRLAPALLTAGLFVTAAGPARAAEPATPAVVSPEWLAARLGSGDVFVVDARTGLRAYLASHVPGALPLEPSNLRSTEGGVPGAMHPLTTVRMLARRMGVPPGAHVVVLGEESDVDATYVATALRLSGLPKVSVLDGGFKRWTKEGRPVTVERSLVAAPAAGPSTAPDRTAIVRLDEVRKLAGDGRTVLLDVRPADQFAAGRLPGAVNRFWKADLVAEGDGAGSFRPAADVVAEYAALGISKDRPVVVYCNTGHQASEAFYTLRWRLGLPDVRLYAGSWVEWSMTPGTPRETSPAPASPTAKAP
ncbi:sulfurtransferase [Acidobacteria bacterium ACD]|nr:MAG: sulfurtransferase [Acidobacteriota bacterium]MDL1950796.1 sulfurtransferase [Acidobacteria bacterium ACD]